MSKLEIAVIVSSFERPEHLRRCLFSLAMQQDVDGQFEIVVADDGSRDETEDVVRQFADNFSIPIQFTTHPHDNFRLARCRNEGAAVSSAPYLLFTDADCLLPADHLTWHLQTRTQGCLVTGDCFRFDQDTSERISLNEIRSGAYREWVSPSENRRLAAKRRNAWLYERLGFRSLPRASGCNIGVWRHDLESVNGFDESFVGWGLEDRDLQHRLVQAGCRTKSILARTVAYHLWHPQHATFVRNNTGTKNLTYFNQQNRPARCEYGIDQYHLNHRSMA